MQLYTLTKSFMPKDLVSNFVSAIWTERYSAAGDVQIVAPATPDMMYRLSQGTFLGLRGVKEIMILETQSIEDGLLTVTGQSLPKFLDQRTAWFKDTDSTTEDLVSEYVATTTAGQLISSAIEKTVINPVSFGSGFTSVDLDWAREKIQGLELGLVDANGTPRRLTIRTGPLYSAIQQLAADEGLGFKLYLKSSKFSTGYVLRFSTYRGKNRTSEQEVHSMVRLTPQMDSLSDVKEVASISNYKNVIYVKYKDVISTHYSEPTLPIPVGFDRRVLLVEADDIYLVPERITEYREQQARDAIANHIYIQAVDGQTSPQNNYKFNIDYGLGDVIELEGFTGLVSKARVTEYIRSQDKFGDKEYPTLSVIDPLSTGFMPDLEPDSDWEDDWNEDPETDFDFDDTDFDDDQFDEDFNPNRKRRKPKPKAPDPDLNPEPEDPNPDPKAGDVLHPGPHAVGVQMMDDWVLDNDGPNKVCYEQPGLLDESEPLSHDFSLRIKFEIPIQLWHYSFEDKELIAGTLNAPDSVFKANGKANGPLVEINLGFYSSVFRIEDPRATREFYWHHPGYPDPTIVMIPHAIDHVWKQPDYVSANHLQGYMASAMLWKLDITIPLTGPIAGESGRENPITANYCRWHKGPVTDHTTGPDTWVWEAFDIVTTGYNFGPIYNHGAWNNQTTDVIQPTIETPSMHPKYSWIYHL